MPRVKKIPLVSMTPGTSRELTVWRWGKAGARPKAYLQASIHANELPGAMAIHHLAPMLNAAEKKGQIKGEIVVLPHCNPIGLSQLVGNTHSGRYDHLGRENFNRNYPDLFAPVADKVGKKLGRDAAVNVAMIRKAALKHLAELQPMKELDQMRIQLMSMSADADMVLDLHCDAEASLHLFMSGRDWPSARDLAAQLGVDATVYNAPYPQTMTFSGANGSFWARLQEKFSDATIPQACLSVTVEYRGQHDVNHALGASDAANLFKFLQRRGVIGGNPGPLPKLKSEATPMSGMDVGYVPRNGVLVYLKPKGAKVKTGEAIAEVIDFYDPNPKTSRTRMVSRTDGILFSRRLDGRLCWPGMVAFRIAGAKDLPHRKGLSGLDD
jgi:predicted deacylase